MNLTARNKIDVRVLLAADVVASVEILPRVRPPLARVFAGKPATSLLNVLPRLFALCAAAQQTALLSAIETARDEVITRATKQHRIALIVTERITDLARGLFVGHLTQDVASAAAIRSLRSELSALGSAAHPVWGSAQREATAGIAAALAALGMPHDGDALKSGSPLALHIAALNEVDLKAVPTEHSFLSVADDRNIAKRLLVDETFCYCPDLDGHVPETGPWARQMARERLSPRPFGAVERLRARIVEILRLCAWLEAGAQIEAAEDGIIEIYKLGPGRAAAAVECSRGRLYHAVELDAQGRISRFEFLAPTEWNFHRRGPVVRNLEGAVLTARRSRDAVHAVIASLDPCVGFTLNFREVRDA
ncbi:hypothetical protein A5906_12645 [Bradyrhizobium sacchari]|uniref:Coenzyme F420-reducing hydrogenase alpha subunit n=1 Tax=Bradyrhizobium sacchari TaxID=1399419 RepID=A0A560JEE7_9BRAD|nr:hypothetical protein [Bradyrhizobium sacchari]OPY94621.1 hypothetical protein A5906_12645 [Bradyrhizobium sacchari]TWB51347.1 coenzyme F420-reducing hydrogenase alpha subunit [Bradyrhizobium sacchari]TWB69581.1 coenzyme F420-reducing hydrogenase alpha subunit [Bradyrhizobium sacchari]